MLNTDVITEAGGPYKFKETTPKKQKLSGGIDSLIGVHTVECTLDGVATYIVGLQTTPKLDTDAVTLHTATDRAFHLEDREDTKQSFIASLKKRIESFGLEKLPEDRTKFPMPVFSGMTGLGKTRMLEEWKGIFVDANVSEPFLGVLVTYGNGHSANKLDELLPIQAGFSWRMLHRLFLENNCAPEYNKWNSLNFIPENAEKLTVDLALRVVLKLAKQFEHVKEDETLSLFVGIDEYQKIPKGQVYNEKLDEFVKANGSPVSDSAQKNLREYTSLWLLIGALQTSCSQAGLQIHPAFAGTRWGPLSIAGSSVADVVRAPLRLLAPDRMEEVVASNEKYKGNLASAAFRRNLFFLSGIPRPSLEYTCDTEGTFEAIWKKRIESKWSENLTTEELFRLVAFSVSGRHVGVADPSGIKELTWGALVDQGLCLIRDDKQVTIPYCVFRLASVAPVGPTKSEQCLSQNLGYLKDNIDAVLFDNPPWQQWEKFGACFFAMRINARLLLGDCECAVKSLFTHADIKGCEQMVVLEPMEVREIVEELSVDTGKVVTERDTKKKLTWVEGDIRYCLVNGESGQGIDIFSCLTLVDGGNLLFNDQRKRIATPLGCKGASNLIKKAAVIPNCIFPKGKVKQHVLGLFSQLTSFDAAWKDHLPDNSFVLSDRGRDAFYGCLSSHPACSSDIDVNWANISTIKLLKSVQSIAQDILSQRELSKFDLRSFKAFCREKG
eukprot:scaffold139166_cov47-Attheya_sp.AAC.1